MKNKLRILLIGYGKMGRAIEQISMAKGHSIVAIITDRHTDLKNVITAYQPNIAFEFTSPESAVTNIELLIENGVPTVCGSTGWYSELPGIEKLVKSKNGSFFYASNFSMGMNLMFKLTELAARFMNHNPEYKVDIEEIHHTEKKDMPSGTAITLAEKLMTGMKNKKEWILNSEAKDNQIEIKALREPAVPGTHIVTFASSIDTIEFRHTAHNRNGFASGAVMAGEWLVGKTGVFNMDDLLKEKIGI